MKPGIEPASSWTLCWVLNPVSHNENCTILFLNLYSSHMVGLEICQTHGILFFSLTLSCECSSPCPTPVASLIPAQTSYVSLSIISKTLPLTLCAFILYWFSECPLARRLTVPFLELMSWPPLVTAQNNINSPQFLSFKRKHIYLIKEKKIEWPSCLLCHSCAAIHRYKFSILPEFTWSGIRFWVLAGLVTFIQSVGIYWSTTMCYVLFKSRGI